MHENLRNTTSLLSINPSSERKNLYPLPFSTYSINLHSQVLSVSLLRKGFGISTCALQPHTLRLVMFSWCPVQISKCVKGLDFVLTLFKIYAAIDRASQEKKNNLKINISYQISHHVHESPVSSFCNSILLWLIGHSVYVSNSHFFTKLVKSLIFTTPIIV